MIALNLHEVDEDKIWNMTYNFYKDVLREIAVNYNFTSVIPIMANPYAGEDGVQMVVNANPLNYKEDGATKKRVTMKDISESGLLDEIKNKRGKR